MSRVRVFQGLVLLSVLLHVSWLLLPSGAASLEAQEALRWGGYGGTPMLQHPLIYFALGALKLAAAIGLLLFLSWGRWMLAGLMLVSLGQIPFNGIAVGLPLDNIVGALTGLVDGAVLALSFALPYSGTMKNDA